MSAVPAAAAAELDAAPPKNIKKRWLVIAAAAVVLAAAAASAWWALEPAAPAGAQVKAKKAPVFLQLEPFTVNLVDKDVERFAQIGLTLEIADDKIGERIKLYLPAIRNGVLMILAQKSHAELLERSGKERLAREIALETMRAMGLGAAAAAPPASAAAAAAALDAPAAPVRAVHFSSFIIQ